MNKNIVYLGICLFTLPLVLAGLFIMAVRVQGLFRYDPAYFTPEYKKHYSYPGAVAAGIEEGLHTADSALFAELTARRGRFQTPEANPNVRQLIVLEVTDSGYYQVLYFDMHTYRRIVYHIKEVSGRWVMVPEDAFYFLDSGDWLVFFTPAAVIWWSVMVVVWVGIGIYRMAVHFRNEIYRPPGDYPKS
jgi:hypothetical protein